MLDEFRSTNITWDKATSRIYSPVTANASDENGRKLVVQIVNSGQVEDLTGATLHLYWITRDKVHDGLDVFKAIDLKKGEFELSYTTGMLSNQGVLDANLVLIDTVGRVVSERFKITVTEGIDNDAIQSENSFTTLTQALIDISNLEQNYAPRLNDLTTQLQQTGSKLKVLDREKVILPNDRLSKIKMSIHFPEGFTWTDAPVKIYRNGLGEIMTDFDASDFKYDGPGKTYYVNKSGSDSNDGLSRDTALRTILSARRKADVATIIVGSGFYRSDESFNFSKTDNKNLNIIADEGSDVIVCAGRDTFVWDKTEGFENVYQTTRSLTVSVVDETQKNEYGDYLKLTKRESILEVDENANSYYIDGSVVYVNTIDSRQPGFDLMLLMDVENFYNEGDYRTYVEGIKFYGGSGGCVHILIKNSSDSTMFVAKNCQFKYSVAGAGGVRIRGADCILQNCTTSENYADGNNYHIAGTRVPKAIEVNCESYHNGEGRATLDNNESNNATTMHDGGKIIRINGTYHHTEGPVVHDINYGTESWNIGCSAYESIAPSPSRSRDFAVESQAKMWLDSCIGYGSEQSVYVDQYSELLVKNSLFDNDDSAIDSLAYY